MAMWMNASLLCDACPSSLVSRRCGPCHANVGSTPTAGAAPGAPAPRRTTAAAHRDGHRVQSTSPRYVESTHTRRTTMPGHAARRRTNLPASTSDTDAAVTHTDSRGPDVSTDRCRLRPATLFTVVPPGLARPTGPHGLAVEHTGGGRPSPPIPPSDPVPDGSLGGEVRGGRTPRGSTPGGGGGVPARSACARPRGGVVAVPYHMPVGGSCATTALRPAPTIHAQTCGDCAGDPLQAHKGRRCER